MTIGILLHPYDENKPAGLARTIFGLAKGILEIDTKNEYIIFVKKKPRKIPELPGKNWKLHVLGEGIFWLDRMRNAPRADVYVFHTPVMPFFWRPPKSIVIALDFGYKHLPATSLRDFFHKKLLYWYHGRSLKRADHVVAISHITARETVVCSKIPEKKITVVYLGFNKICELEEETIEVPPNFFLFVGVLKPRKNPFSVIKAFIAFNKHNTDYKLVIAGKGGGPYYEKMQNYIREHNAEESIVFTGFVTDHQLSFLYKRAFAFVFPTLLEGGFGFPILEAMDCGLPTITSGQGPYESMEETVRDSALLVDPLDVNEIAKAMGRLVAETGLREKLILKGFDNTKIFSWHRAGRELLAVVEKLV